MPGAELTTGAVVGARYEVIKPLGKGGMGVVYQARDRLLNEIVAIKVLRRDVADSETAVQRFVSEIKLARSVSHKNVCRIHEYGEDGGLRFISMAFVDGVDLRGVLRERGALPPSEAYEIAISISRGLQAIHEEGIIHRDLKAANVMIDARGVIRLMDFGIAKLSAAESHGMTVAGQMVGTPQYMSPEQVRGERLDARSDVYALGVLVYELFTGRPLFRGDTPIATALMHLHTPPPLEEASADTLPAPLVDVLRRALAKERAERFATAAEMADALSGAWQGAPRGRFPVPQAATVVTRGEMTGPRRPTLPPARPSDDPTMVRPGVARARSAAPRPAAPPRSAARTPLVLAALTGVALLAGASVLWFARRSPAATSTSPAVSLLPSLPASSAAAIPGATLPARPEPGAPTAAESTDAPARPRTDVPAREVRAPSSEAAEMSRHLTAAEEAMAAGDLPALRRHMASARRISTSDPRLALLAQGADDLEKRRAHIDDLVRSGEEALTRQDFDLALLHYAEVLKLEPANDVARLGRATALNAKVTAQVAAAVRPAEGHRFVSGKTSATAADAKDKAFAEGFAVASVPVTRDTGEAATPGRVEFAVEPETLKAGDRYTLSIHFMNTGQAPIQVREFIVTTTTNGKRSSGPVKAQASLVGPGQRAVLLSLTDYMRDDARTFLLEALVITTRGDSYRNQVTWK